MKIKKLLIIFFPLIFLLLTACSEQQQIHQKLIVQGIAIDYVENKYALTVQALDFQNPAGEEEPNVKTLKISGNSLVEALESISKQTNLEPVYSQNLVVIIGEEIAKMGIDRFMDFFVRHYETRPKVKVCVTKGSASEIFKCKSDGKPIKSKNIHDLIPENLNSDILHFVANLKSNILDSYAAWLDVDSSADEPEVCLKGVALFKKDVLKDYLYGDEAMGFMLLKGVSDFGACSVSVDSSQDVTCSINEIHPSIESDFSTEFPNFTVNLQGSISVFAFDKKFDAYFDENIKILIRKRFSEKLTNMCTQCISKCISMGADFFDWGRILKNCNPHEFRRIENSWNEYIQKCKYKICPEINVTITGKEIL